MSMPSATHGLRSRVFPVLAAELTKLWTLRSTLWSLGTAFACMAFLSWGFARLARYAADHTPQPEPVDPVSASLGGMVFAQLAMVVFGVLAASSEYRSGELLTSLRAVPRRGLLLGCKAVAVAALAVPTGIVGAVAAFVVGRTALGEYGAGFGEPGVARAVLGAGVYLGGMAVLALGVSMTLRDATAALSLLLGFFFLASPILSALPRTSSAAAYLPDAAGSLISQVQADPGELGPWSGFTVFAAWIALALGSGGWALWRRDVGGGR